MSRAELVWRTAEAADASVVIAALDDWWQHEHMVHGVCPQLLDHVGDTCLIVEERGLLVAFLVGFMSQRHPDAGYVHYMGVRPDRRSGGIGAEMYTRFAALTRERGRTKVMAEIGAWNARSIAFHQRVGFVLKPGDEVVGGLPVIQDTTGHGVDYVEVVWTLGDASRDGPPAAGHPR